MAFLSGKHAFRATCGPGARADRACLTRPRWRGALRLCPVILGVLALTVGCDRAKDAKKDAPPPPLPQVVVAEVVQRTVPIIRDFTARTDAIPTVEVRARVPGVLEQVLFKEGTEVKQGQTLFVIQRDEYAAALESARAQLAKAQADLTRARDTSIVDRARAPGGRPQGRAGQGAAGRQPVPPARRGPGHSPAGPGYLTVPGEGDRGQHRGRRRGPQGQPARSADPDSARRGRGAVCEGLDDPGGAESRLHDGAIPHRRDHRAGSRWTAGTWWARASPRSSPPSRPWTPSTPTSPSPRPTTCGSPAGSASTPRAGREIPESQLQLFLADDSLFPQKGRLVFVDRAVDPKTGTIERAGHVPQPAKGAAAGPVRPGTRRDRRAGGRGAGPPARRAGGAGGQDGAGRGGR